MALRRGAAKRISEADQFSLGRTLLCNGLSLAHFAAFFVEAGFVRDQRSKHTAKQLLKRFRANELRVYYDLTFKQVRQ